MNDMNLPWHQVVKGDIVVIDGKWYRVVEIEVHGFQGGQGIHVRFEDIEGNENSIYYYDPKETVRVRPTGIDPWEGRRKEGRR